MTPPRKKADADALLVAALTSGLSYARAAEVAGCSLATVNRRMRDEDFRDRVEDARTDRVARTADRLTALAEKGLQALNGLLDSPNTSDNVRARIGLALPALAASHRELVALEARVIALEARLLTNPPTPWRPTP